MLDDLKMDEPIWVWCYLTTEKRGEWRSDVPVLSIWPDAHTFAFRTEEEALQHPDKMNWPKVHAYALRKVYLQTAQPSPLTKE